MHDNYPLKLIALKLLHKNVHCDRHRGYTIVALNRAVEPKEHYLYLDHEGAIQINKSTQGTKRWYPVVEKDPTIQVSYSELCSQLEEVIKERNVNGNVGRDNPAVAIEEFMTERSKRGHTVHDYQQSASRLLREACGKTSEVAVKWIEPLLPEEETPMYRINLNTASPFEIKAQHDRLSRNVFSQAPVAPKPSKAKVAVKTPKPVVKSPVASNNKVLHTAQAAMLTSQWADYYGITLSMELVQYLVDNASTVNRNHVIINVHACARALLDHCAYNDIAITSSPRTVSVSGQPLPSRNLCVTLQMWKNFYGDVLLDREWYDLFQDKSMGMIERVPYAGIGEEVEDTYTTYTNHEYARNEQPSVTRIVQIPHSDYDRNFIYSIDEDLEIQPLDDVLSYNTATVNDNFLNFCVANAVPVRAACMSHQYALAAYVVNVCNTFGVFNLETSALFAAGNSPEAISEMPRLS